MYFVADTSGIVVRWEVPVQSFSLLKNIFFTSF